MESLLLTYYNHNPRTTEVWEWKNNFISHLTGYIIIYIHGLKLNHVDKKGPRGHLYLVIGITQHVLHRLRSKLIRYPVSSGGEPTKVKCNYISTNVITFGQM